VTLTFHIQEIDCGVLKWQAAGQPAIIKSLCESQTQVNFTPPPSAADVVITLCMAWDASLNGEDEGCNHLVVPSSVTNPFIRSAGSGFNWHYNVIPNQSGSRYWNANLTLSGVGLNLIGNASADPYSNAQSAAPYLLIPYNPINDCASAEILGGTPASSWTSCTSNLDKALPYTTVNGNMDARVCEWRILTTPASRLRPAAAAPTSPQNCLTVEVPGILVYDGTI
jgi:hypothetical protein